MRKNASCTVKASQRMGVRESVARFQKILEELEKSGTITRSVATMPQRMKDVIAAKGGPTKW